MNRKVFLLALILVVFLTGCKSEQKPLKQTEKKQVVASIYPVYEFAKVVAGDKMDVSLLLNDKHVHDKELGVADLKKIQSAEAFLYNGGGIEPWVDKLVASIDNKKLVIVNTGSGLFATSEKTDPHIWLDVSLAIGQVEAIVKALSKLDEKNADYYKKNGADYIEKLNSLHKQYTELGQKYSGKEFVVMHPAFGYMANRYNFKQIALVGLDEHSEPTALDVARVCNVIKDKKIKFVFVKSDVDDKVMKQVADATNTKVLFLDSLESSVGSSYLEVMQVNLQNLKKAFEG